MKERDVSNWEEFVNAIEAVRQERAVSTEHDQESALLFRGQGNSCWQLGSTLERKRTRMLYKDYYRSISRIKPQIESLVGGNWQIPSYPDVEALVQDYAEFDRVLWAGDRPAYAYMAYLRHHGFPSPLLDWSRSPYVAAYFAFAKVTEEANAKVSIYVFCERKFKASGNQMPVLYSFGPYVKTHRRHVLQQSQYTVCLSFYNEWRFENYDAIFEDGPHQQGFCWKFNIPASERPKVLKLLDEHNLNAFSLFSSEGSLMEALTTREFDFASTGTF